MPYKLKNKKISLVGVMIGLLVIGIFTFVFGNVRDLIFGTSLTINTAQDGATLEDTFLPITGVAKHARSVSVNGRDVFIDRDGNFTDAVILSPGYNVIEVALRDQFGKEKLKTYHLVFDSINSVAQIIPEIKDYK